jgi:hypothetical protein
VSFKFGGVEKQTVFLFVKKKKKKSLLAYSMLANQLLYYKQMVSQLPKYLPSSLIVWETFQLYLVEK